MTIIENYDIIISETREKYSLRKEVKIMRKITTTNTFWTVTFERVDVFVNVKITPYADVIVTSFGIGDACYEPNVDLFTLVNDLDNIDIEYLSNILRDMNELAGYLADINMEDDDEVISTIKKFGEIYELTVQE